MPMSLNQLFPQAERDLLIRELTLDSRGVRPGDLFLAVPGGRQDGRAHIADALARRGCRGLRGGRRRRAAAQRCAADRGEGLAAQLSAVAGRFYGERAAGWT